MATFTVQSYLSGAVQELPNDIAALLGHIAHQYSELEQNLRLALYAAAGVDEVVGRLAIGISPRPDEQLTKIQDIVTHLGLNLDRSKLAAFKALAKKVKEERDAVVHGVWIYDENKALGILDINGPWDTGVKELRVTKRMYPPARPITKEILENILRNAREAAAQARGLSQMLHEGLPPSSRGKSVAQSHLRDQR